jgi:hypothetical protein
MERLRRIVVLQPHEWLHDGFSTRKYAASAAKLDSQITTRGMRFDARMPPSRIPDFGLSGVGKDTAGVGFALAAEFENEDALARFA